MAWGEASRALRTVKNWIARDGSDIAVASGDGQLRFTAAAPPVRCEFGSRARETREPLGAKASTRRLAWCNRRADSRPVRRSLGAGQATLCPAKGYASPPSDTRALPQGSKGLAIVRLTNGEKPGPLAVTPGADRVGWQPFSPASRVASGSPAGWWSLPGRRAGPGRIRGPPPDKRRHKSPWESAGNGSWPYW